MTNSIMKVDKWHKQGQKWCFNSKYQGGEWGFAFRVHWHSRLVYSNGKAKFIKFIRGVHGA